MDPIESYDSCSLGLRDFPVWSYLGYCNSRKTNEILVIQARPESDLGS
jgi:hypothetical protein